MSQQNPNATASDAVALLSADYDKVKHLFREFEKCDPADLDLQHDLALQICMDLTIHAVLEEEIFYPAVRGNLTAEAEGERSATGQAGS